MVFEPKGNAVFSDDENNAALQSVDLIKYLDICVRQHLAEGRLVRGLAPWCRPFPGFYLYVPSRAQMPAKVRALMDFLVEQCERLARESLSGMPDWFRSAGVLRASVVPGRGRGNNALSWLAGAHGG